MVIEHWNKDIPTDFADTSRVWVYQCSRPFTAEEEQKIKKVIDQYVSKWTSHRLPVKGWAKILFHQFIIIMADDTSDKLCGSAIDGSIRFVKKIETKFNLELLNRMNLGFLVDNELLTVSMSEVENKVKEGILNEESLFFNNTVSTKESLLNQWIQPLKDSFIGDRVLN